jgi:hypothetical protein
MVTVRAEDLALIVGLALLIDDRTDEENSAMHRCRTVLDCLS